MIRQRYDELIALRGSGGFVPYSYCQVIHESGQVGPYHPDGLREPEHAAILAMLRQMPPGADYCTAMLFLADPVERDRRIGAWRESGRLVLAVA